MSKIEWTDVTWNPIVGCTRVSEGCRHCYAERMAKRLQAMGNKNYADTVDKHGRWTGKVNLVPDALEKPLHWRKPRRIFVCSMSDLFHESVPDKFIAAIFSIMLQAQTHTFQVLTKRPKRMHEWISRCGDKDGLGWITHDATPPKKAFCGTGIIVGNDDNWPLPNVHLGVSVENQAMANERIPWLLQAPAAVHWISLEPMLGPVDLWDLITDRDDMGDRVPIIDGVVVGGESGPGARPMHPDWVRSVRDQCQEAGVAFFFKQWGEWFPKLDWAFPTMRYEWGTLDVDGNLYLTTPRNSCQGDESETREYVMIRVGKKAAGRVLDGRTWDEWPGDAAQEAERE